MGLYAPDGSYRVTQIDPITGGLVGINSVKPIIVTQASFESSPGGITGIARYVVPAGKIYHLKAMYGLFSTDITVANRRIGFALWDSSNTLLMSAPFIFTQPASNANMPYLMSPNTPQQANGGIIVSMPDIPISGGYKIGFANVPGQAGAAADTWTNLVAIFEDNT